MFIKEYLITFFCTSCLFLNANILITEIIDPVDDYRKRYVEICNIGDSIVDISDYYLYKYHNGSSTNFCSKNVPAGTILMSNDCFIFYHSKPPGEIDICSNSVSDIICVSGNGNDAYELNHGNSPVDVYGVIGQDGGIWDYQDSRVYRNYDVTQGTTVFNLNEWIIEPSSFADNATPCSSELVGNSSCNLILSDPVFICLSTGPSIDELIVDIPYTGFDTNAKIQIMVNNTAVINVSDDPSVVDNGVISFYAFEGDSYTLQFVDSDCSNISLHGTISSARCSNYYEDIEKAINNGSRCADLKTALHQLIDNHTVISYTSSGTFDVRNFMCVYDLTSTGSVLDRYTNDQQGNCSDGKLPNGMSRDHVLPSSWWGGSSNTVQYSDLFNLFPSDASANSSKSNYPLGNVGLANNTTSNGTQIGSDSPNCIAANVFEPIDVYKGDFARTFLYMATRYEDIINSWENQNNVGNQALSDDSFFPYEPCLMSILLLWHQNDPVSQLEIDRNEAIFNIQGNRNPFVDHPEYVALIWGAGDNEGYCEVNSTCPPNLLINENTTFQNLYQSSNTIATNGFVKIKVGQQVEYNANRVTLNDGFKVITSASFKVRTNGCN